MKLLTIFIMTCLFGLDAVAQEASRNNEMRYTVVKAQGLKDDIKKVLVTVSKKELTNPKGVTVSYYAKPGEIYLEKDSVQIGYYNVSGNEDSIMIDNFRPFRERLSSLDPNERKYKVAIVSRTSKAIIVEVNNWGEETKENLLEKSVLLTLKPLKQ
ncbi:hypothetical protein [Chitinophaga ginsengisoli]|uniref:Uncharacterized protein n=1 Tax=Chitinophaga ginsengisoli TaxID=363837 RepID=A0A2P8G0H8_9BACT|nr:hypothetical protein [Chitinophaga ginsengisoli]PSL27477.1 hypothetical protein CLV42_1099 [Chitinophaga ginsengisoli]